MTTKSFIKTIGEKGLLADYNTSGKKLLAEDSIDQTYSPTSTKAQSGVSVNEAFKTRETSTSDDSYTYLGMTLKGPSTEEKLYWKLVSFKPAFEYWTLQFEIDVCNGRKAERSFDSCIYETKRLTIYSDKKDAVRNAIELRYTSQSNPDSRGYGNNIYYEMDSSGTVTIYIYTNRTANTSQTCRLTSVRNFKDISNITWYEPVSDAGTQPTNPIKFKEEFPAIASKTSDIGSDSVPVYVNKGKPVSCNSSNLKAGKDDDGNVIKNTYQKKLLAGNNITIDGSTISSDQVFVATYGTTKYAEVKAAYDAGKICTVFNNDLYYYINLIDKNRIRFISQTPNPVFGIVTVFSNDSWEKSNSWLQSRLTFDSEPTAGSNNPVTSDGIKTALNAKADGDNSVAIFDGYMRRLNESTGWRRLAYKQFNLTNTNLNALFRLYLFGSNNDHIGLGDLVVNIRFNSSGSVPELRSCYLMVNKPLYTSVKVKVIGVAGNAVVELWFKPLTFSMLTLTCLGNGLDVNTRKKDWTFGRYIDATDPEPVEDIANNIYVFSGTVKRVQLDIDNPTSGNLVAMDEKGLVKDSGISITSTDIANWNGKMDRQTVGSVSEPVYLENGIAKVATDVARVPAPTSTTGTQVLKCIDGVIQWVTE